MKVPKAEQLASGAWSIRMRLNGQSVYVYGNSERECIRNAEALKAKHRVGEYIPAKAIDKTVGAILDEYIDARRAVRSPATIRGYTMIRKHRFQSIMGTPVKSVKNWQKVIDQEYKFASAKTVKNAWGLIAAAFRHAKLDVPDVSLSAVPPAQIEYLTYEDIKIFLDAIHGKYYETAALLALHSLRCSEVMGLDWRNVDIERNCIHVSGATVRDEHNQFVDKIENKNETSTRTIPIMIPRLKELLIEQHQQAGKVVTENPNTIYNKLNTLCQQHNLPQVGWHGLRHTFASLAYHLEMPELVAAKIGGWKDLSTMHKIYTHIAQQDVERYGMEMKNFYNAMDK